MMDGLQQQAYDEISQPKVTSERAIKMRALVCTLALLPFP